jgi:2-isopropylmalate synthase
MADVMGRCAGLGDVTFAAHCHDDLGLSVANSLAGIEAGAGQVECTINGLGERAGNASLEEIAVALTVRSDYYDVETGIDTTLIAATSRLVAERTGYVVQRNKAVVGANAFAHEAGIHQDGMLKDSRTYQIIDPRAVGVSMTLPLGKHSGRHAFAHACAQMGVELGAEDLDAAFLRFKALADTGAVVTLDELFTEVAA